MKKTRGNIAGISKKYQAIKLDENDISLVYGLCRKNKLYYEFCPPFVTAESIKADMTALPPGKSREDKFICHSAFCRVTFFI